MAMELLMPMKPEEVPYSLLLKIRDRIFAEVKGVNRVLYDLSSKPLATIEYE